MENNVEKIKKKSARRAPKIITCKLLFNDLKVGRNVINKSLKLYENRIIQKLKKSLTHLLMITIEITIE